MFVLNLCKINNNYNFKFVDITKEKWESTAFNCNSCPRLFKEMVVYFQGFGLQHFQEILMLSDFVLLHRETMPAMTTGVNFKHVSVATLGKQELMNAAILKLNNSIIRCTNLNCAVGGRLLLSDFIYFTQ